MCKKIGVISHYYNSKNYGGLLQSYALCKLLTDQGFPVEQICYDFSSSAKYGLKNNIKRIIRIFQNPIKVIKYASSKLHETKIKKDLIKRNQSIANFEHSINHSKIVYNSKNIHTCVSNYDIFISGSDQVWNLNSYHSAFFLDFVPSSKIKISYAASISLNELTHDQLDIFRNSLKDFHSVSVREQNAVELISKVSPVPIFWVLDPTLLLSIDEWNEICSKRIINGKYMFCYFLGDDLNMRKLSNDYAIKHKLRIITLPNLLGYYRGCDKNFGDERLYDVSPLEFISLIKYSECVFTDSFHAVVFSFIFKKQYIVFQRSGFVSMGSRIKSLTSIVDTEDRFCDKKEKQTLEYLESLKPIDYNKRTAKFDEMQEKSYAFLKNSLESKF